MKFELTELEVGNLLVFLDRVALQGHQEREAMNRLCSMLSAPVLEEKCEAIEETAPE